MPAAVLALILLTEARRPARIDAEGDVVLLSEQDRSRWDQSMITEGRQLLAKSLRRTEGIADPYQLQAAIAAEHDRAADYPSTDWAEIVRLYDLLVSVAPSAPAQLSRAVAVAERDGPDAGLRALQGPGSDARVEAVRSELLARSGRFAEAVVAGQAALDRDHRAGTPFRERRRAEWMAAASTDGHGRPRPVGPTPLLDRREPTGRNRP